METRARRHIYGRELCAFWSDACRRYTRMLGALKAVTWDLSSPLLIITVAARAHVDPSM